MGNIFNKDRIKITNNDNITQLLLTENYEDILNENERRIKKNVSVTGRGVNSGRSQRLSAGRHSYRGVVHIGDLRRISAEILRPRASGDPYDELFTQAEIWSSEMIYI